MWCALNGVPTIALGTLAANPFPDADAAFFGAFSSLAGKALGCPLEVVTPFAGRAKAEVVEGGRQFALDLTFSCIAPRDDITADRCNKCAERRLAFSGSASRTRPSTPGDGAAGSSALIAPVSFGLGDLVVSLPVHSGRLRKGACSGRETWLVTRSDVQVALSERIGGLAGTVAESDVVVGQDDVLIDLRDHPLQRDAWWGSPGFEASYGPLSINEIIASDRGGLRCRVPTSRGR